MSPISSKKLSVAVSVARAKTRDLLVRPFRQDLGVALAYNVACTVSTILTALIAYCYGIESRELLGLGVGAKDTAIFSGLVQVVAYATFCGTYYPFMAVIKIRGLRKMHGRISRHDFACVVGQCGVDFSIHFWIVDLPCHFIGGILQTFFIWTIDWCGFASIRVSDALSTILSQMVADLIFTPLEAPIWRLSGRFMKMLSAAIGRGTGVPAQTNLRVASVSSLPQNAPKLSSLEASVTLDKAV